jgi:hypothetical protein
MMDLMYVEESCSTLAKLQLRIYLPRQPLLQLVQRFPPMTYLVLLALLHLRIRLALILKARIPALDTVSSKSPTKTIANSPNTVDPLLGTNLPSVRPWNKTGSCPGPSQYAKVHTACADLSSKPSSSLCICDAPRASINHLLLMGLEGCAITEYKRERAYIYGPGRSFMAMKQRHVSSTKTGPWTYRQSLVSLDSGSSRM